MWCCVGECGRADGVAQGSAGSVFVSRCVCVCVCMGRVVSLESVESMARQWGSGWFHKAEEDGRGTYIRD